MALLKVIDGVAFLCLPGKTDKKISEIKTEDIEAALEAIYDDARIEVTPGGDTPIINNPADKIIFDQLCLAFTECQESREAVISEIDSVFVEAEAKYLSPIEDD